MNDRTASQHVIDVGVWRKSSRSGGGGSGDNCVEAGTWRKSTRSDGGGNGSNCVEAASCNCHGIAVRDSKHLATPPLAVTRADWTALLDTVKSR